MKKVIGISLGLIVGILILVEIAAPAGPALLAMAPIRYAAIGDSYSIGEGASPEQAWPSLLAAHLTQAGMPVTLVANPSRTGWTTQQAIDDELPVWQAARPELASVQIGVNDWVQGVDAQTFQHRLRVLLNAVQQVIPDTNRVFLVTIPDFSVTPAGALYIGDRDAVAGLTEFNNIIRQEAAARGLQVVDLFTLSQHMKNNPALTASDGLHPSAKEYALWEEIIFPVVKRLLTTNKHQ
jgi:acyl-CoA thioesterase I